MRRALLLAVAVMLLGPALTSCARLQRGDGPAATSEEPANAAVSDTAAVNAEARRVLQTRAFNRLRAAVAETERMAVREALETQVGAWNRGDLEGFMTGYRRSDDVRFVSGATVSRGWARALGRYRDRYPTPDEMGTLSVSDLDIDMVAPDAAVVFGRWRLTRAESPQEGVFTLVFRKIDGRWLIVHDHTAAAG